MDYANIWNLSVDVYEALVPVYVWNCVVDGNLARFDWFK